MLAGNLKVVRLLDDDDRGKGHRCRKLKWRREVDQVRMT